MKASRKFFLILCASAFSQAAITAEGHNASYTFLSTGLAVDNNGLARDYQALVEKRELRGRKTDLKAKDLYPLNATGMGGYLNSSYGFDNHIFLEVQLRYLTSRQNGFFAGVGYYVPVGERSSLYVLGGISKPDLPVGGKLTKKGREFFLPFTHDACAAVKNKLLLHSVLGNIPMDGDTYVDRIWKMKLIEAGLREAAARQAAANLDKAVVNFKSSIAPAIEVGYRIHLSDDMGLRFAYRLSLDDIEITHVPATGTVSYCAKSDVSSHKYHGGTHHHFTPEGSVNEFSVGLHYHFIPELAVEAGYTFTKPTQIGLLKPQGNHRGTVGLRCTL